MAKFNKMINLDYRFKEVIDNNMELLNFSSWVEKMLDQEFNSVKKLEVVSAEKDFLENKTFVEKEDFSVDKEKRWLFVNRHRFSNDHFDGVCELFRNSTGSELSNSEIKFILGQFKKSNVSDDSFSIRISESCPVCKNIFSEFVPKFAFNKSLNFYVCYSCYENNNKGCFDALEEFKKGCYQ